MPTARPADDAAIREQAYYFWEADGRPDGRESEYWMRALVAVTEKAQKPAPKTAAKPKVAAKPETKAAATKTKPAPAKAEPAKKPKKK